MGTPISPETVWNIAKFAYGIWQSCKAARGDYDQVATEVIAMRTILWIVKIELEDPEALVNRLDTRKQALHKQLGLHAANCKSALNAVDMSLKKFNKMGTWDKLHWAVTGKDEINGLIANLTSFGTQLNTFMNGLNMKAGGKILAGVGRVEELLEQNGGDEKAAVKNATEEFCKSRVSRSSSVQYEQAMSTYVAEANKSRKPIGKIKGPNEADRGRRKSGSTLGIPSVPHRAHSVGSTRSRRHSDIKRSSSASAADYIRPNQLECWLIQHKTGDALVFTWHFSEKQLQPRGQWKLESMAKQFQACKAGKLDPNHELVDWVVQDRQKEEPNSDFVWRPYAAKLEPKGDLILNLGVEKQAMVIIKRQLTPQAQAIENEKARLEKAKKDAAKKKADAEKAKNEAAKKVKEDALKKAVKLKEANAARKAEIERLRQDVERLKLALDEKKTKEGSVQVAEKSKRSNQKDNNGVIEPKDYQQKDKKQEIDAKKEQPKKENKDTAKRHKDQKGEQISAEKANGSHDKNQTTRNAKRNSDQMANSHKIIDQNTGDKGNIDYKQGDQTKANQPKEKKSQKGQKQNDDGKGINRAEDKDKQESNDGTKAHISKTKDSPKNASPKQQQSSTKEEAVKEKQGQDQQKEGKKVTENTKSPSKSRSPHSKNTDASNDKKGPNA